MEFGTWYQINCEGEDEWRDDFSRIRHAGFDFVVLWHMLLPVAGKAAPDLRLIVSEPEQTQRTLDEAARAGLTAYLGIWHPYSMGSVRPSWRLQWSDGRPGGGPDIFNKGWLRSAWRPYVQAAGKLCSSHVACRGVFLDDTFPATPGNLKGYLSYSAAVHRRFHQWLAARYGSVANLNMMHQLSPGYRSFSEAYPPRDPLENLALWTDWMQARDEWCQDFIATARRALNEAAAIGRRPELVLSDRDYHIQCTALQYGVEYGHLMPHLDRLETYMAAEHTKVSAADLIGNVRRSVRRGVQVAGGKPFLFHTWFADLVTLQPMHPALLARVMEAAAEEGAAGIEVYTYKVHDWRQTATEVATTAWRSNPPMPALREASLKYNPEVLAAITRTIRRLAGHG